tara:strand:+ start:1560 stop:2186 length:627 start_codon:yes stop_codon:yes gene_type:complete
MDLSNLSYILEILTGIVALVLYKKYAIPFYKFFLGYLLVVIVVESLGVLFRIYQVPATQVYNIYTFFEYNLIALIYYNLTKETVSHKWIKSLMIFFNIVYFISFIFINLQDYTVLIGAIIVSLFMIFYLKELLKSDKIITFQKDLSFWITIAFLLYYLSTIPFYTVLYVISLESKTGKEILFTVQNLIIILTQLCFISGLIWSTKQKN